MTLRVLLTVLLCESPTPGADAERCDTRVLNVIFGNEYLAENVRDVCTRAEALPPEDRYEFLTDWVLPGDARPTFRLHADFTPTYPAPPVAGSHRASGFRVPTGGGIISPALDLIATASSLDRLEELRHGVEAITMDSAGSQIDRLALLALIDMARDDLTSARANLAEIVAMAPSEQNAAVSRLDAVLLCADAATAHPALSRTMADAVYRIVRSYQNVIKRSVWQQHFAAAHARVKVAAAREGHDPGTEQEAIPLLEWLRVSLPRARRRGAGYPAALWKTEPGQVETLSSHVEEFLYFNVPLRGDFEVECDVTGYGQWESQLLVAGTCVGRINQERYELRDIQGTVSQTEITPPLTKAREYIRDRTVVRDGSKTTYLNGRPIHDQTLSSEHDPWLAIRGAPRSNGRVRNLRVTGNPIVPRELRLTVAPDLAGWIPYYEESMPGDWRLLGSDGPGEVQGRRQQELPRGCHKESALFYHRPMLEDGSIEYEFWCDPGVSQAHPALDRLCFLLQPDGVRVHWLTDGPFDRTELAPDNLLDEPVNRRSLALPLHERDWNRLRLSVHGDTADLNLNGELVYQRRLEPTNQRNFGLFHYADQTELRVRNVTWTGDWPEEIPGLDDQELAIDETGFLDERLPELTAVFSHDFAAGGLPLDRFTVIEGDIPEDVAARPDGLQVTRQGTGGYRHVKVAPILLVRGDFDITACFDQLVTDARGTGSSSIFLKAVADNQTADECLLLRRFHRGNDQQYIECVRIAGSARRRYFDRQPVEALSGTLRLARRGETIYYLFAENDSRQFRLIGEDSFPDDDLQMKGVRMTAQIDGETGSTSVVWKELTIRAVSLSGPATTPIAQHTP